MIASLSTPFLIVRNDFFLVADSLRYDAEIEAESVWLSRCFSQRISTAPSMTAMLTGRYPLEYGGTGFLEPDQPTMTEQFRRNGYTTGAIHSNPNFSRLRNFDRWFDTFEENILPYDPDGHVDRAPDALLRYAIKAVRILRRRPYRPVADINRALEEWIAAIIDPWLRWTQYMSVHGPYLPGVGATYRERSEPSDCDGKLR